jgi:hypothetical protein
MSVRTTSDQEKGGSKKDRAAGRGIYPELLAKGELEEAKKRLRKKAISYFDDRNLKLHDISERECEHVRRLQGLYVAKCEGKKSWEGLVIGFPGTKHQLSTYSFGTPHMRKILFPILACFEWLRGNLGRNVPCLYILGESFSDVWLRKFRFLNYRIPNVIILSEALKRSATLEESLSEKGAQKPEAEAFYQHELVALMSHKAGAAFQVSGGQPLRLKYLGHEIPTGEGTENPERLDLLAYDMEDKALVAFEIKGPKATESEMENLFFQGMDHRDWLEKNKMAIKFVLDKGPKGRNVNVRKRVKMILGYCDKHGLSDLREFAKTAKKKDPYLELFFCNLNPLREGSKILTLDRVIDS